MSQAPTAELVREYLSYRRRLGFALQVEGAELTRFARYVDSCGHRGPLTAEIAIRWAKLPQHGSPIYHARRLDHVRRFARYLKPLIPETQVPPEGVLGPSYRRRPAPHIYSPQEIAALLEAAGSLGPRGGLRPHTYRVLFGLLASTGMRISEALGLSGDALQVDSATVRVRPSKYHDSRALPLHPSAIEKMAAYAGHRDSRFPAPRSTAFFLTECGSGLKYHRVYMTFRHLCRQLGWRSHPGDRGPRIHDLRHTFAVRRLLEWERSGQDVQRNLQLLSMYLGHEKVADTYWYLTAVPDLMAIASGRFERFALPRGTP